MFQTMEKELETKFTDLLSIVNDDNVNLDKLNSQLTTELDEKLQNIEQVKEELDKELKKRDSLIEFEELDKNGYFSDKNNSNLMDYFDKLDNQLNFQKNNCETIIEEEKDDLNELRTNFSFNLNSVLEEDENEDCSPNNDLIEINDELNKLNNSNLKDNTLSPKLDNRKRNSNCSSITNSSITNSSITNSIINNSISSSNNNSSLNNLSSNELNNQRNSLISLNNSNLTNNSSTNTLTSSINNKSSIPNSTTSLILSSISQSVLNLENLNNNLESNVLVNNIIKKGILNIWQNKLNQNKLSTTNTIKNNAKKIFFSIGTNNRKWKSRYFMLTENYLLCFKKEAKKSDFLSSMGKYQFRINILDDIRSINLNETVKHGKSFHIDINEGSIYLFDKDFNQLKTWYDCIFKSRQRCELKRQEQELKFRKEKQIQRKEILSEQIERRKLILPSAAVLSSAKDKKVENLLDKFSEKYLESSSSNSKLNRLSSNRKEDDFAFEYLNNLKQRLSCSTSVTELNRSNSNLNQIKTNTPIISNRKRMSLQRKSLLSQFDSFLGSPLTHSSSKQQLQHQDNIANNIANLAAVVSNKNNNLNSNNKLIEGIESPNIFLPKIASQCQVSLSNKQQQQQKQLTNSCSVFQFNSNLPHQSPFAINNSPALKRSLYAERILSNSSLTLSNISKYSNSRTSLSGGFSNSLFKPFRESIHYATSLRKDNNLEEQKSNLKTATSEFSFIRLTTNSTSNTSTLAKTQIDDDTLKRNNRTNKVNFNRMHSFANEDYLDSEQDLSTSTTDYNSDTLRNELKNSKTITNLNSELSNRTLILNANDIGINIHINNNHLNNNQLINNKQNYQKLKKINNSLDESDSTFSSSNSSSSNSSSSNSSTNNYEHLILNKHVDNRLSNISYSPKLTSSPSLDHRLSINSPKLTHSPSLNHASRLINNNQITQSPLTKNSKKNTSSKLNQMNKQKSNDHTYQKVNNKRTTSKQLNNTNNNKLSKNKKNSLIPISNGTFKINNEPIYQSATSTEKRKSRMNKILENQSKIYVTMSDLK